MVRTRLIALLGALLTLGCRSEKVVQGVVRDFASDEPIPAAEVTAVEHGWGFRNGSLVWDKDRSTSVTTGPDGRFRSAFRSGSSVRLVIRKAGYQRFEAYYRRGSEAGIRLKRRVEDARRLPEGFLRLGLQDDGTMYGWDFSRGTVATSPEEADILPVAVGEGARERITFRTPADGGVVFVPSSELGVDNLFLVFTDSAPEVGYQTTGVIDFESEGGVYFVRTRDGERFAKFELVPGAFAQTEGPGIVRDLSLHYVYNPDGSRDLLYQVPE